jgi:2-iminobutanoate/2-iminopropanoate deaminase
MKVLLFIVSLTLFISWFYYQNNRVVSSSDAPEAIGPYSQAILTDNTLYLSGQIAINPKTNKLIESTIEDEVNQIMANHKAILDKANMNFSNIVKATVYLKNMEDFAEFNKVYAEYFPTNPPARETVEVSRLPKNANIEISFIAVK